MSKEMTEYQQGIIEAFAKDPRFRDRDKLIAFAKKMGAVESEARTAAENIRKYICDGHLNIPYNSPKLEYNQPQPRDLIWQRRKNESKSNGSSPMTSNLVEKKPPTPQDPVQQIENAITSTETALLNNLKGQHPLEEIRQLATSIVMFLTGRNHNQQPLTSNDS